MFIVWKYITGIFSLNQVYWDIITIVHIKQTTFVDKFLIFKSNV